jgi:two-component system, cell cycle response regulator DivK
MPIRRPSDIRVLVVEDDADSREMYAHYFAHLGMKVETAVNGIEAVERAGTFHPDVIIMDVSMPLMSGDVATGQIKAAAATRHIPIIALSGFGTLGPAERSRFDVFVRKPCLPEDLAAIIRSTVDPEKEH